MTTLQHDEAFQAIVAYKAASETALASAQQLNEAWRHFFEDGPEPSPEWVATVAAQQQASELALDFARSILPVARSGETQAPVAPMAPLPVVARTKHRRRRENKFLARLGMPGKRLLRVALIVMLASAVLVATGAGISLALEVAGILHLIDDPVQLPFGIQLAIFIAATGVAYGLKKALKLVERALYGSKGIRPKGFQL
ncbi:MAG: hypothetical protein H7274_11435 [Rhodoferax sp.]|nr:hypothetical protein [Rhodoferax sp.]